MHRGDSKTSQRFSCNITAKRLGTGYVSLPGLSQQVHTLNVTWVTFCIAVQQVKPQNHLCCVLHGGCKVRRSKTQCNCLLRAVPQDCMHAVKQLFPRRLMKFPHLGAPSVSVPINSSRLNMWLHAVTRWRVLHSCIFVAFPTVPQELKPFSKSFCTRSGLTLPDAAGGMFRKSTERIWYVQSRSQNAWKEEKTQLLPLLFTNWQHHPVFVTTHGASHFPWNSEPWTVSCLSWQQYRCQSEKKDWSVYCCF